MTPEEHMLLLTIVTKQAQYTKLLLDVLKRGGLLSGDDAQAFEFAANVDVAANVALFEQSKERYLELAKGLGVETGLENLPPLQAEQFRAKKP